VTPSDWQAQHLHKPNNPQTVKDWQAALIAPSSRRASDDGVPPARVDQERPAGGAGDYADKKHGKKVKFLNFREALERLRSTH